MNAFQTDRQTLIDSLKASKGWTTAYAAAFVDTFGDACGRKALIEKENQWEQLATKNKFDRYPYLNKQ